MPGSHGPTQTAARLFGFCDFANAIVEFSQSLAVYFIATTERYTLATKAHKHAVQEKTSDTTNISQGMPRFVATFL